MCRRTGTMSPLRARTRNASKCPAVQLLNPGTPSDLCLLPLAKHHQRLFDFCAVNCVGKTITTAPYFQPRRARGFIYLSAFSRSSCIRRWFGDWATRGRTFSAPPRPCRTPLVIPTALSSFNRFTPALFPLLSLLRLSLSVSSCSLPSSLATAPSLDPTPHLSVSSSSRSDFPPVSVLLVT